MPSSLLILCHYLLLLPSVFPRLLITSCVWLCKESDMNCSMPAFFVLQCLQEFAQTHVHWVGDAIQAFHLLSLKLTFFSPVATAEFSKLAHNMWSSGEGNVKPRHYSCLENPTYSMKRQKDMTPEDEPLGQYVSNILLGKSKEIVSERMKRLGQSRNDVQLWMFLVVKFKSSALKNNIT